MGRNNWKIKQRCKKMGILKEGSLFFMGGILLWGIGWATLAFAIDDTSKIVMAAEMAGAERYASKEVWWGIVLIFFMAVVGVYFQVQYWLRQQRQVVEEKTKTLEHLQKLDHMKDLFLAESSREMYSPLRNISGLAETLLEGAAGEMNRQQRLNLKLIAASAKRLEQSIGDIVDYSELRQGILKLEQRPVDLKVTADVAVALVKPLADQRKILLYNGLDEMAPVCGDERRLQQIIYHLLENAIRFTVEGEVVVERGPAENGWVGVAVRDTGVGIPEDKLHQLRGRLELTKRENLAISGGTDEWSGLFVTKQLVELHNGKFQMDSKVGEGTRIYFSLPFYVEEKEVLPDNKSRETGQDAQVVNATGELGETSVVLTDTGDKKYLILIVEDDSSTRQLLANYLMLDGYRVEALTDGGRVWEMVESIKPDMVIMDMVLPKISGLAICRRIRQRYSLAQLPVLLMARNRTRDMAAGLEAGASDCLEKPFNRQELAVRVRTWLDLATITHELEASRDQLTEWNRGLEIMVANRTQAVRNLLDNAGQGFLAFGEDFLIHDEYSQECIRLLGDNIVGKDIWAVLFAGDPLLQQYRSSVGKLFAGGDAVKRSIYLSLLPEETTVDSRVLSVHYKWMDDPVRPTVMVILTDVTAQKALEEQMAQDRKLQEMVAKVAVGYDDFLADMTDYQEFCREGLLDLVDEVEFGEVTTEDFVAEVFRKIHTFKGLFAQYSLADTVGRLHRMEEEWQKKSAAFQSEEEFSRWRREELGLFSAMLNSCLERDRQKLKNVLGEAFLQRGDMIHVRKSSLLALEEIIRVNLPPEQRNFILSQVQFLRYRNLKDLIGTYREYVTRLSGQLEKPVETFQVMGDTVLVDPERYKVFLRSLVHIFRNAVEHGLEDVEERLAVGKPASGSIRCLIRAGANQAYITIADDGRGIDSDQLRQRMVENGWYDEEHAALLGEEQVLDMIFREGFSTQDDVSELSGRGMGMAAVRNATEKMGGRVNVITVKGEGTSFHFVLPLLGQVSES